MRLNLKNIETTSFKKRYNIGIKKHKLLFGEFSFMLCKSINLEYIYLYNFKKILKKFLKTKIKKNKKVWLFFYKNYPLTKKSKNSRMGKGKGGLSRYCSRIKQNHNIFEFVGFNLKELLLLKKGLKQKINIPLEIKTNFFLNVNYNIYSNNEYLYFCKKYYK